MSEKKKNTPKDDNKKKKAWSKEINNVLETDDIDFTVLKEDELEKLYNLICVDYTSLIVKLCKYRVKCKARSIVSHVESSIERHIDDIENKIVDRIADKIAENVINTDDDTVKHDETNE